MAPTSIYSPEGGADGLDGDTGDDTLIGDDLVADAGSPMCFGVARAMTSYSALAGRPTLGDAGRDELDGGPGNDDLDGGPGDDLKLFGTNGNDKIRGGPGRFRDRLVGVPGRMSCVGVQAMTSCSVAQGVTRCSAKVATTK